MLIEKDFIATSYSSIDSASFEWSAPSNIALVKYWGKKENQIPANPSISFTLNNCKTITKLEVVKQSENNSFSFDLLFEGKPKEEKKADVSAF